MAKTCLILGPSGDGKTTSLVVNSDGEINFSKYKGMNPETTVIFNTDGKDLPFPGKKLGWVEGKNVFTSTYNKPLTEQLIEKCIKVINKGTKIKSIIIDTINGSMNDKEMLDTKKMTFDKWADLAKDYYKLFVQCNSMREDLVIYVLGHIAYTTLPDDTEYRHLITNGKKLEKISLESKVPIVLHTEVQNGPDGANEFFFITQKNNSSGKSPVGMFKEFRIPNSLKLVDDTIREYYSI